MLTPAPPAARTVLVADDQAHVLMLFSLLLRREGFAVLAAPSAAEALRLAGEHPGPVALALLDAGLPGGGRALAGRLRGLCPGLAVLYTSGALAEDLAHRGALDPSAPFLAKPFTAAELVAKVREAIGG